MRISILKMLGYGDIYSKLVNATNSHIKFSIINVRFLCLNN